MKTDCSRRTQSQSWDCEPAPEAVTRESLPRSIERGPVEAANLRAADLSSADLPLSGDDLAVVRALMVEHPGWHRTALSRHLCQLWNWRNGAVGENVQYLVKDARGRELAVMVFGAAAWKVAARDRFIGWSLEQRQQRLGAIANQQRFPILAWVRAAHLASHLRAHVVAGLL